MQLDKYHRPIGVAKVEQDKAVQALTVNRTPFIHSFIYLCRTTECIKQRLLYMPIHSVRKTWRKRRKKTDL